MEAYIVIVFAIVCTISQFSQIVIADLVPVHVKEFVEFCGVWLIKRHSYIYYISGKKLKNDGIQKKK